MRKCLQQRRQKHAEGVSAGPSDQKQDEKQAGDDEPCPTFLLSHCDLPVNRGPSRAPLVCARTGFRLFHPRSESQDTRLLLHVKNHFEKRNTEWPTQYPVCTRDIRSRWNWRYCVPPGACPIRLIVTCPASLTVESLE